MALRVLLYFTLMIALSIREAFAGKPRVVKSRKKKTAPIDSGPFLGVVAV